MYFFPLILSLVIKLNIVDLYNSNCSFSLLKKHFDLNTMLRVAKFSFVFSFLLIVSSSLPLKTEKFRNLTQEVGQTIFIEKIICCEKMFYNIYACLNVRTHLGIWILVFVINDSFWSLHGFMCCMFGFMH